MIKYVQYDSHDEYGQHIFPVDRLYQLNKTADNSYSPELLKVIASIQKKTGYYYVVINAMGSYEVWGDNGNGDAFPETGLSHKSLRTDMGTKEDYGYKTFEYYAHFFKHHVNKPDSPRYGEVLFSHWNDKIHRVELIVGIDVEKSPEIIKALDNNEPVAVSIGIKVPFDRCVICGNTAKTRKEYCKHASDFMGIVVDEVLAKQWSIELNKIILPGSKVFVFNDFPRGFDISRVYLGADKTSFILAKVASKKIIPSVDIAEAYGITDSVVDKFAQVDKKGEMDKDIGANGPNDIEGQVIPSSKSIIVRKALREKLNKLIEKEPEIPAETLDSISSTIPVKNILSTMIGLGIHPKPREFQRIILVSIGKKDMADDLDKENTVFKYDDSQPETIDISSNNFLDSLGRLLIPFLKSRSCYPDFIESRLGVLDSPCFGRVTEISKTADMKDIASLYAGLKMKANGYTLNDIEMVLSKPWLSALLSGGIMYKIMQILKAKESPMIYTPASQFEGLLDNTDFSGHIKQSSFRTDMYGNLAIGAAFAVPAIYAASAYNQRSLRTKGYPAFNPVFTNPKTAIPIGAVTGAVGLGTFNKIKKIFK